MERIVGEGHIMDFVLRRHLSAISLSLLFLLISLLHSGGTQMFDMLLISTENLDNAIKA